MIKLTLNIEPVAKGRPRFTRLGRAYTPATTRMFEATAAKLARSLYRGKPMEGALKLTVRFVMPRPVKCKRLDHTIKPDLSNLTKSLEDSLNGICWLDDSQIVRHECVKFYDLVNPQARIELTVEAI